MLKGRILILARKDVNGLFPTAQALPAFDHHRPTNLCPKPFLWPHPLPPFFFSSVLRKRYESVPVSMMWAWSVTGHAAQAEYIGLLSLSADIGVGFIPVHLRFSTPSIGLGNERLAVGQPQCNFPLPNVLPYRRLRERDGRHLRCNPAPDPMGGMPLFSGCDSIALQNRIDEGNRRLQFRSRSNSDFSIPRDRAGQRLAHQPPMNSQLSRHPFDRPRAEVVLPPNLLK